MLENLTQRLSRVMKTMRGEARMTEANIGDALPDLPRIAVPANDTEVVLVDDHPASPAQVL